MYIIKVINQKGEEGYISELNFNIYVIDFSANVKQFTTVFDAERFIKKHKNKGVTHRVIPLESMKHLGTAANDTSCMIEAVGDDDIPYAYVHYRDGKYILDTSKIGACVWHNIEEARKFREKSLPPYMKFQFKNLKDLKDE